MLGDLARALSEKLFTTPALSLALLGLALLGGGAAFLDLPTAFSSLSWPVAKGRVISSEVYEACCGEYNEGWSARVTYAYSVNGKNYQSDRIESRDIGDGNTDYFVRRVVQRYPAGSQVDAHYDPANPRRAVLEPGCPDNSAWNALFLAATGAGLFLIIVSLWMTFERGARRQKV